MMNKNNTTTSSTPFIQWQYWRWIVPVSVNSIFILMTTWILFSLIYYGNKSKMWVTRRVKNFEKLNAGYILMAAVLCAVTALLRFIANQFVFNIAFSYGEDGECKMAQDASTALFCLAYFSVFIYLWVRQLVFYTNHMLNTDFSKALRFFSYFSIILISVGGFGATCLNTITTKYMSTLKGCVYVPFNSTSSVILVIISALVLLCGQIMLVGLLIYPLHKHSKQKGCLVLCGLINCPLEKDDQQNARRNTQNQFTTPRSGTNQKINMILRRTVCYSILIVVINLVLFPAAIYGLIGTNIYKMLYDTVTFANLGFVLSSIGGWKKIVCLKPPSYSVTVNAAQQAASV